MGSNLHVHVLSHCSGVQLQIRILNIVEYRMLNIAEYRMLTIVEYRMLTMAEYRMLDIVEYRIQLEYRSFRNRNMYLIF